MTVKISDRTPADDLFLQKLNEACTAMASDVSPVRMHGIVAGLLGHLEGIVIVDGGSFEELAVSASVNAAMGRAQAIDEAPRYRSGYSGSA